MKKSDLKQIIKEEISLVLREKESLEGQMYPYAYEPTGKKDKYAVYDMQREKYYGKKELFVGTKEQCEKFIRHKLKMEKNKELRDINKQLNDLRRTMKGEQASLFTTEFFRVDTFSQEFTDEVVEAQKQSIESQIKNFPYVLYIYASMDEKFYLGVTSAEYWWFGKDMDGILGSMSMALGLGALQGEVEKAIVYKKGKAIYKTSNLSGLKNLRKK